MRNICVGNLILSAAGLIPGYWVCFLFVDSWGRRPIQLMGFIMLTIIFSIIGSFQLFNEPNILQTLAPNGISSFFTPNMYAYNLSFAGQQFNYSAAIAIIMGVLTMVVAYVVQLVGTRKDS